MSCPRLPHGMVINQLIFMYHYATDLLFTLVRCFSVLNYLGLLVENGATLLDVVQPSDLKAVVLSCRRFTNDTVQHMKLIRVGVVHMSA